MEKSLSTVKTGKDQVPSIEREKQTVIGFEDKEACEQAYFKDTCGFQSRVFQGCGTSSGVKASTVEQTNRPDFELSFAWHFTVGRRYFTVTGKQPDDEVIENIINHGGEEYLSKAIQEHGRGNVLETVVEIQDHYDAAKEIETSLLELHQVFLDMDVMVEAQGEKMDDIKHYVMNAAHYVNDGTKNLKTAKGYQRSSRKCMCVSVILLLIIILVILIPVVTIVSKS
ncbi:syntaxin-related protein KNOLLE [Tanacetum coccineum]